MKNIDKYFSGMQNSVKVVDIMQDMYKRGRYSTKSADTALSKTIK